jgi:hypothetical protein
MRCHFGCGLPSSFPFSTTAMDARHYRHVTSNCLTTRTLRSPFLLQIRSSRIHFVPFPLGPSLCQTLSGQRPLCRSFTDEAHYLAGHLVGTEKVALPTLAAISLFISARQATGTSRRIMSTLLPTMRIRKWDIDQDGKDGTLIRVWKSI